jgi:hypothetical protein
MLRKQGLVEAKGFLRTGMEIPSVLFRLSAPQGLSVQKGVKGCLGTAVASSLVGPSASNMQRPQARPEACCGFNSVSSRKEKTRPGGGEVHCVRTRIYPTASVVPGIGGRIHHENHHHQ